MSQLLLSTDEWIQPHFEPIQRNKVEPKLPIRDQREFVKFDAKLLRHLLPHRQFTQVATKEDFRIKKYTVLLQNISKKYKGLLNFTFHKLQTKVSISFQLLNPNGSLFKLETLQMLIQFARNLHLAQRHSQFPLKVMVNYESLEFFFGINYFSSSNSNLVYDMERTKKYTNIVLQIYKNFIQKNLTIIQNALEMVVPLQDKLEHQQQKKLVQNLYRYATMMTMKSNFSVGEIISQQAKVKQLQQREQSGRKLQMKKLNIDPESIKSFQLYGNTKIKKEEKGQRNKSEFYISGAQEKVIKKEISFQLPQSQEDVNKKFLTFLNPIYVHQPQKLVTYTLSSGGFSQIYSAEVHFWLAGSTQRNHPPELNPKDLNKKILAVKRQLRQNGKNLHQARILSQLKAGYVPFLPKYYLPLNLKNNLPDKNPLLMMDMLIYGNLADFMKNRKKSVSMNSKLVLMFSITLGLRFLQKFKVVHLDFKPGNIMMSPGFLVKIIDFGEAYHSQVIKKQGSNHKPGITLPYSPPQTYRNKKDDFTSKSDIYSLGVIFYELIFGKRPFQNKEALFLAPEQCDKYGDVLLLRVLHWMISRCLSANPEERPQLDWISMILRICMYLVI